MAKPFLATVAVGFLARPLEELARRADTTRGWQPEEAHAAGPPLQQLHRPASLGNLTMLTVLTLHQNMLSLQLSNNSDPSPEAYLPASLGNLTRLRILPYLQSLHWESWEP